MADDPNNPQREEVIRRERLHVRGIQWFRMRVQALMRDAATTALHPGDRVTRDEFVAWAEDAFRDAEQELGLRVAEEMAARDAALRNTNEQQETKP